MLLWMMGLERRIRDGVLKLEREGYERRVDY